MTQASEEAVRLLLSLGMSGEAQKLQMRIDSPEVAGLAATITDRLREEMSRHGQAK